MKLGEFRALTQQCGDDWDLEFKDPNFSGRWHDDMTKDDVSVVPEDKQVLIYPPLWEPVE
jgi:hypothetical protein